MEDYINKIIHGDCLEVMKQLPDKSIDLVLTSPPYDNLRDYGEYVFNFPETAKELFRVIKGGGVAVWVVADQTVNGSESGSSLKQALYFKEIGFNLHDTMIYKRWSGPLNHNRYEQEFEYMFIFSKGKPKTFNPIRVACSWHGSADRTGQKYAEHNQPNRKLRSGQNRTNIKEDRIKGNIWHYANSSQTGEKFGHPAPFPKQLAIDHIKSWSNKGDIVLDPFLGSGTTCVASKELGRNYIGIEVNESYYHIADMRVSEAVEQLSLLDNC